jgi:hypothetical protein
MLLDSALIEHRYAPHLRDYEVTIDVPAAKHDGGGESYFEGRYVYRFTHCPEVHVTTPLLMRPSGSHGTTCTSITRRGSALARLSAMSGEPTLLTHTPVFPT